MTEALHRRPRPRLHPHLHEAHWPPGVPQDAVPVRETLPQRLARVVAGRPDKAAIVYGGATLTYATLWRRIEALAGWMCESAGVQPGDRVLVIGQNAPQWVVACQAVLRAGAVALPVNPMCKREEIAFLADNGGARVAIAAQELLPQLRPLLGDGSGQVAQAAVWCYAEAIDAGSDEGRTLPDWVHAAPAALGDARLTGFEAAISEGLAPPPLPADPDALALLPYTSGTTGQPKGCRHTHATLLASLTASAAWKPVTCDSVVLTVAPLFHMLGLQNGQHLPLIQGATTVMLPRWDARAAGALMERHRVTAWSAPPAMVLDLFAHPDTAGRDLSSLSLLSGGGAAMPDAVAAMLRERYGLVYQEAYGLTETASFLHANPPQRCKRQCLGVPTQGVDSRIVDPVTLQELPPGEVGELVTHAPQVMLGYWRAPEADAASFITLDGQRFLRTGDLACMDEDGYFFLRDRLKRMINVSGYKVWPAEVESLMYAHPAVHEACVIALPDAQQGESVKALLVLKPGAEATLSPTDVIAWCREHMAVYKAPRQVEFVASLPKSGTGKILWRELQDAHTHAAAAAGAAAHRSSPTVTPENAP
ncbi:MAG: AMP-binding protein [Burkholderiales bacterium]|nr:AMP-binding protein [Burkholderiales bacterium]